MQKKLLTQEEFKNQVLPNIPAGMTAAKFGELHGMKRGVMERLEAKGTIPDARNLVLLANALGVSIDMLLTGDSSAVIMKREEVDPRVKKVAGLLAGRGLDLWVKIGEDLAVTMGAGEQKQKRGTKQEKSSLEGQAIWREDDDASNYLGDVLSSIPREDLEGQPEPPSKKPWKKNRGKGKHSGR